MAKWLAKEFDWNTGRYTGNYYDIVEAGIVAVFVDSFYGLDTNAGTAIAPFRTLTRAINHLNTNGANGSRIFMNGVFSENLPTQTFWYEFIGCGGGWCGYTIWNHNIGAGTRVLISRQLTRIHNVRTVNYNYSVIYSTILSGSLGEIYFVNCFLTNISYSLGNSTHIYYYFCKIYDIRHSTQNPTVYMFNSAAIRYDCGIEPFVWHGANSFVIDLIAAAWGGGAGTSRNFNIGGLVQPSPQLINVVGLDWNVRITSPLLQAGTLDEVTGIRANVGGVQVGLPYTGLNAEFNAGGGATITNLTVDANGRFTLTPPNRTGTLVSGVMDLGNIYPLENIDLFNIFDFLSGEITQGVFETFSSPRMALTIKLKYGLTSAEVNDCPWLLIEYGKQPTFSGTGASRVGNADDAFDPNTFQTIICRYMKLFVTLQNNS